MDIFNVVSKNPDFFHSLFIILTYGKFFIVKTRV